MSDMVTIEIRGKHYPLCLTVAALDEVSARCGNITNLHKYLRGDGDWAKMCDRVNWLLDLLAAEGKSRAAVFAEPGEPAVETIPDAAARSHIWDVTDVLGAYKVLLAAVAHSVNRNIEVEDTEKNSEQAERA